MGRAGKDVPLGTAKKFFVVREVARVGLFTAYKVEVCPGVVDDVGGIGRSHGCFGWFLLVKKHLLSPTYVDFLSPGSNDSNDTCFFVS
jgi:hypothetical protein